MKTIRRFWNPRVFFFMLLGGALSQWFLYTLLLATKEPRPFCVYRLIGTLAMILGGAALMSRFVNHVDQEKR